MQELRIETTPEERKDYRAEEAYVFKCDDGYFLITEEWKGMDEVYADGYTVFMPLRIWHEALEWYTALRAREKSCKS